MEQKVKIEAAKRLINDEGIMLLLTEYLLEPEEKLNSKAIATMTNEQIGEIARAELVKKKKIRSRFGKIKNLSIQGGKPKPAAKA